MTRLIVERAFEKPLGKAEHKAAEQRLGPCLEAHNVQWIRSYLSTDRCRMICEYEAPDAEAVRIANRSAGVSFDRVWNADLLLP